VAAVDQARQTVTRVVGRLPAALAAAAVALAAIGLAALAPGSPLVSSCVGAGGNRAALVVEHGDGSVVARCVSFGTVSVTGEALLNLSGVAWSGQTFGGFGDAVCAIDAEPSHYSVCPGADNYWAIFVSRSGGPWQLASVGISSLTLGDGDAEGFRYVPAVGTPAAPASPAGVCAGATTPTPAHPTAAVAVSEPPTPAVASLPLSSPAVSASGVAVSASAATPSGLAAATSASPRPEGPSPVPSPAPAPSGGVDPGLLLAAGAGGGLAGLALLRLLLRRVGSR
jgi:hypothetical protein